VFVAAVHALRLALFPLASLPAPPAARGAVLLYECIKFSVFYLLFTAVQFGARSYLAWSAERLEAEQQRALSQQAKLLQLTQQLQPHFLFNAINTVSSLIHSDPDRADALLTQLAALLRAATDAGRRPTQPLAEELRLLRAYAAIMAERFADRVQLDWCIEPAALGCDVPTLSLQPLLENCFRHVVEPRRALTCVVVAASCRSGCLVVEIADDGGQLPARVEFGVGLSNLQQRLSVLHAGRGRLALKAREGGGVAATLELPCAC
jgi:two-component system LytT family sensor kinase